jgi:type II secretory ATPase GspE/PulE/Tfp pilus assembly ATPase PilB-like protein
VQYVPSASEVDELGAAYGQAAFQAFLKEEHAFGLKLWKAPGCAACGKTGYKGRLGLHELLVGSDELKRAIQRKAPVDDIRRIAADGGMITLLQDGIRKVIDGQTDLKQVLAVCSRCMLTSPARRPPRRAPAARRAREYPWASAR